MISHCPDTECQYYNPAGCTAKEIHHSTDRFCVSFKRKDDEDYTGIMQASEPSGYKWKGRWIKN